MDDHPIAAILTLRPVDGQARRVRIERAPSLPTASFWWVEQTWDGRAWRTTGREPLADIDLEADTAVIEE